MQKLFYFQNITVFFIYVNSDFVCKETLQDLENLSNLNFLNSGVYDFMSVWSISHISFF